MDYGQFIDIEEIQEIETNRENTFHLFFFRL
jgi:hypothetical protein